MPSQWLLKKDIDRWKESCREKICLPVRVSSPGKIQVEEKPTYSAYLVSWLGKCAATQARSPQLHSVVVALGICCGFKRLWGYASASQKSHKQNSGEEKKKRTKTADLIGEAFGIFLRMPKFSLVFPSSVIRKIIISHLLLLLLSGLLVVQCVQADASRSSKEDYFSHLLESFPGDHRLKSFLFRILKTYRTYRYHPLEKLGIPFIDCKKKNPNSLLY